MKKYFLILFLCCLNFFVKAQADFDIGITAGTSFYFGDINQDQLFYRMKPAYGGFARLNIGPRYSIRLSGMLLELEAKDADFKNAYQQNRDASFNTRIGEAALLLEFNFVPFIVPKIAKSKNFSPYFVGGIAYSSSSLTESSFATPMGMGVKFIIKERLTGAIEWCMRKTFNDKLDNLEDPLKIEKTSSLFNNDWYSYTGITLSYKLFQNNTKCRTFDNYLRTRKRR